MIETLSCFLFCIALYGSPGPATLSMVSSGISNGLRESIGYLIGIVSGIAVTLVVTFTGLGAMMHSSEIFTAALRYVGFTYIMYLGWKIATSSTDTNLKTDTPFVFKRGLLLNTLNPKAYVAVALVYSQFESRLSTIELIVVIMGTAIFVDLAWCIVGSSVRKLKLSPGAHKKLNWAFGLLLVGAAFMSLFV